MQKTKLQDLLIDVLGTFPFLLTLTYLNLSSLLKLLNFCPIISFMFRLFIVLAEMWLTLCGFAPPSFYDLFNWLFSDAYLD